MRTVTVLRSPMGAEVKLVTNDVGWVISTIHEDMIVNPDEHVGQTTLEETLTAIGYMIENRYGLN